MCIEFFSPSRTGIGEQDIDVVRSLFDFLQEAFYVGEFGGVGRY